MPGTPPLLDLALGFRAALAVLLLDLADQLLELAFGHVEIVVGQLAPLLLGFALELGPVAFENIAISCVSSFDLRSDASGARRPAAAGSEDEPRNEADDRQQEDGQGPDDLGARRGRAAENMHDRPDIGDENEQAEMPPTSRPMKLSPVALTFKTTDQPGDGCIRGPLPGTGLSLAGGSQRRAALGSNRGARCTTARMCGWEARSPGRADDLFG